MTDVFNQVIQAVQEVKGSGKTLDGSTEIDALALDSLDEVEIMMLLEERLGIEIDQARIRQCSTLGEFARAMDSMRR